MLFTVNRNTVFPKVISLTGDASVPCSHWLNITAYLLLNSSLNLCNRYTLGYAGFRFPVFLTCCHLAFQILSLSRLLGGDVRGQLQTYSKSWRSISAVGLFLSCNIALNNASLLHLSLPFNQIIRATIPVICAICAVFVEKSIQRFCKRPVCASS